MILGAKGYFRRKGEAPSFHPRCDAAPEPNLGCGLWLMLHGARLRNPTSRTLLSLRCTDLNYIAQQLCHRKIFSTRENI